MSSLNLAIKYVCYKNIFKNLGRLYCFKINSKSFKIALCKWYTIFDILYWIVKNTDNIKVIAMTFSSCYRDNIILDFLI